MFFSLFIVILLFIFNGRVMRQVSQKFNWTYLPQIFMVSRSMEGLDKYCIYFAIAEGMLP